MNEAFIGISIGVIIGMLCVIYDKLCQIYKKMK